MSNAYETPWTVAHQAALSKGFPRQEYQRGLPLPPLGDLPGSGIELASPALASGFFTTETPGKPSLIFLKHVKFSALETQGPESIVHCWWR